MPPTLHSPMVPRGAAMQNPECLLALFSRLPEDLRARAACACRQWRLAKSSPKLHAYLNLGETSGVAKPVTPNLLISLCRQRGAHLVALDLSGCSLLDAKSVIAAVSSTPNLSELKMPNIGPGGDIKWSWGEVRDLFAAVPRLRAVELDVENEQEILDRTVQYAAVTTASIVQGPSFLLNGVVFPLTSFSDSVTGAIAAAGSSLMASISDAGAAAADTIDWLIDPDYGKKKPRPAE